MFYWVRSFFRKQSIYPIHRCEYQTCIKHITYLYNKSECENWYEFIYVCMVGGWDNMLIMPLVLYWIRWWYLMCLYGRIPALMPSSTLTSMSYHHLQWWRARVLCVVEEGCSDPTSCVSRKRKTSFRLLTICVHSALCGLVCVYVCGVKPITLDIKKAYTRARNIRDTYCDGIGTLHVPYYKIGDKSFSIFTYSLHNAKMRPWEYGGWCATLLLNPDKLSFMNIN